MPRKITQQYVNYSQSETKIDYAQSASVVEERGILELYSAP